MNLVWPKLAVILACTLAGERGSEEMNEFAKAFGLESLGELNLTQWVAANASSSDSHHADDSRVCPSSCGAVESNVMLWHTVAPTPIAACAWFIASLPTLVLRSRQRTMGIRACLWQLLLLWLNLVIAYFLFARQRVWGYVWAVHAAVHTLVAWAPSQRVIVMHASYRGLVLLGVAVLCVFAWQAGPPVGLISWRGGWTSQCGLSAHLLAVLGVDFVGGVLTPFRGLILGV